MQTEKQRIIWAYKILFLDVLFPLSLRKVIFMDSDQIIRADVAELWHMDLEVTPVFQMLSHARRAPWLGESVYVVICLSSAPMHA